MNELKELKDRLSKINQLLDKLDERLALGEIGESRYKELSEKYRAEADGLKNQIAEKELLQEVGLKAEEKEAIVEYPEEEPEKPVFKEGRVKYCSNCGALIDEKAEICPKCGARVSEPPISRISITVSKEKSVALAVVLSFFIPGLGQIYCGKVARGVGILALSVLMFFIFGATAASAGANSSEPLFPFLMLILVYIWNIYDAYKLAEKINRREA
jgi:RNA polymerase subunit RPABC4/transcription elongation factor Spt4